MPAALTSPPFRVHPAKWVPTLYFAEGLPFFSVATIAALMFKSRGASVAYGGLLGCVPFRCSYQAGQANRGHHRHDLWLGAQPLHLALDEASAHLVCDRGHADNIRCRLSHKFAGDRCQTTVNWYAT